MGSGTPRALRGRFAGRSVLVTGGASGIGRATALRFAAEGAIVAIGDIDLPGAERVAEEIAADGGRGQALLLDQADADSVDDALEALRPSGLDVVCVNAGAVLLPLRTLEMTDLTDWDRIHAVNLRGAFVVARASIPFLRRRGGGVIVFTASVSGMRGHPGSGSYAASKSGVLGLSRSLAAEVAAEGIRVNCVCPGAVATPMGGTIEALAPFAAINPLGRVAMPEDIAAAITFLASDDARHITAAELVVDGGLSMRAELPSS